MIHFNRTNPDAETVLISGPSPYGPPRPMAYACVGTVRRLEPGMGLSTGEVEGKVPLLLTTDWGDATVAYFERRRRPKVGTHVGVHGTWLVLELEVDEAHADCELCRQGEVAVDFQLEVERWAVVPEGYDPLLD